MLELCNYTRLPPAYLCIFARSTTVSVKTSGILRKTTLKSATSKVNSYESVTGSALLIIVFPRAFVALVIDYPFGFAQDKLAIPAFASTGLLLTIVFLSALVVKKNPCLTQLVIDLFSVPSEP